MKKITKVFALAMAFMMAFVLQTPVKAAENPAIQEKTQASVQEAYGIYGTITYLTENTVGISINNPSASYVEVQLCDQNGTPIASSRNITYATFSLTKNRLYYYRLRGLQYDYTQGAYVPVTEWSNSVAFTTAQYKVKKVGKSLRVKIKTPKVPGIKNYTIYMSYRKDGGWKKLKKVKAGKAIVGSKFKGKSFKYYKNYYYKIVPNKGTYYIGGFYFYRSFR